jgi:hypothetical protein
VVKTQRELQEQQIPAAAAVAAIYPMPEETAVLVL